MMNNDNFCAIFRNSPQAVAFINGSEKYPNINGRVMFYTVGSGVMVRAEITGLPKGKGECNNPIYAFHIHGGTQCAGNEADAFADTHGHYNPKDCPHPYHAGDMPPLFSVNGKAFLAFLTDRFTVWEILGRAVIIHIGPDDFTTQPSGNAGEKIACGLIRQL